MNGGVTVAGEVIGNTDLEREARDVPARDFYDVILAVIKIWQWKIFRG